VVSTAATASIALANASDTRFPLTVANIRAGCDRDGEARLQVLERLVCVSRISSYVTVRTLVARDVMNRLSEVVQRLEREHGRVVITEHGPPTVVVLSMDDLESLEETLAILSHWRKIREGTQSWPREERPDHEGRGARTTRVALTARRDAVRHRVGQSAAAHPGPRPRPWAVAVVELVYGRRAAHWSEFVADCGGSFPGPAPPVARP
jgi:prevent-host-death family protein